MPLHKRPKIRNGMGNQDKARLGSMPLEIFCTIGELLGPAELLALAQTCKGYRWILLHKNHHYIWERSLAAVEGLPTTPAHLAPLEYAFLAFGRRCFSCSARTYGQPLWLLNAAYCSRMACRPQQLQLSSFSTNVAVRTLVKAGIYPATNRGYGHQNPIYASDLAALRSEWEPFLDSCKVLSLSHIADEVALTLRRLEIIAEGNPALDSRVHNPQPEVCKLKSTVTHEDVRQWFEERKRRVSTLQEHATACATWYERMTQKRIAERARAKRSMQVLLLLHARTLGYGGVILACGEDEIIKSSVALRQVHPAASFKTGCMAKVKHRFVKELWEIQEAMYSTRHHTVYTTWITFINKLARKANLYLILPGAADLFLDPAIEEQLKLPPEVIITPEMLLPAFMEFGDSWAIRAYAGAQRRLTELNMSPTLASTVLYCAICKHHFTLFNNLSLKGRGSWSCAMLNRSIMIPIVEDLIRSCNMDPARATMIDMYILNPMIICKVCPMEIGHYMDWHQAVEHAIGGYHNFIGGFDVLFGFGHRSPTKPRGLLPYQPWMEYGMIKHIVSRIAIPPTINET
ncbi:hypothetical protein BD779DRAFT_1548692 [Infundibulicybe gibba]|nr:hypothetical protein BD779DRAFT_1548692 [Infundibulicybe gibba]